MLLALASLPAPRLAPGGAPSRLASPPIMQVPPMRMFEDDLIATELAPTNAPEVAADLTTVVQGGSLRTWSYDSADVEQVQIVLSTEGGPLDATVEHWRGPHVTPTAMRIYVEDGQVRPVSMVIETPRGPNTVGIRNLNMIEFPIAASVDADEVDNPSVECVEAIVPIEPMIPRTFHCECDVDSVQVLLETQGEPMSARIELLQGPMDNKQVIELTTEDGFDFPFFCRLETPGSINVVRIINTGPGMLMGASVVPHSRDGQVCFPPAPRRVNRIRPPRPEDEKPPWSYRGPRPKDPVGRRYATSGSKEYDGYDENGGGYGPVPLPNQRYQRGGPRGGVPGATRGDYTGMPGYPGNGYGGDTATRGQSDYARRVIENANWS